MNALSRRFSRLAAALALVAATAAQAGGPLSICYSGSPAVYNGTPIAYNPATVTLNYDLGPNGSRTNAQMATIVNNAIALWNNVPTATVTLSRGADLASDIVWNPSTTASFINNFSDGINPVVYDSDGAIIDGLLGSGAKNSTLGFAGSAFFLAPTCRFAEGRAVINGFIPVDDTTMTVTIAHEIGHLIGMDHTQIDSDQGLQQTFPSNYPLMYPIAYRDFASLHEDDEAAVTELYPGPTMAANYGQISGTFTLTDGVTPVRGANIWAQETTTNKLYSIVSDYLIQNTGFYRLRLPPGSYRLRAGAIKTGFTGGSSVGPYSELGTDLSFQAPLYVGGVAMSTVTLGGGTPTVFNISAGCSATLNWRINGTGTVGGNCTAPPPPANPASMISPVPGTTLAGSTVTFTWNDASADLYQVFVGTSVGAFDIGFFPAAGTTGLSAQATGIPTDGRTIHVRLYSSIGGTYYSRDYTYTAATAPPPTGAVMATPVNGATLGGASQAFTWNNAGATSYTLSAGTAVGLANIAQQTVMGPTTTATLNNLPTNGSTVFVRLTSTFGLQTVSNDYTYTAFTTPAPTAAAISSPANGSTLAGSSVTFNWNNVGASLYQVWIGNSVGAFDIGFFPAAGTTELSTTVTGLPVDGRTLYVRLYSNIGGVYYSRDYTYTAFTAVGAAISSPANGATLAGTSQLFSWNNAGATSYTITAGSTMGASNYGSQTTAGTSATISGLPSNGSTIHVRLSSTFGTSTVTRDTTYTAFTAPAPTGAAISSPANGSTLAGSSVTFNWNDVGASLYQVWVGTTVGGLDLGYFPTTGTTGLSTTVTGLPVDGRTLYVRLYSNIGGVYYSRDYTYTAFTAVAAAISSPANGATLTGTSQLFSWNNAGATSYTITAGSTPGASNFASQTTAGTSATLTGLPANGTVVFVRLTSTFGGSTVSNNYTYVAFTAPAPTPAAISSPANGSTLPGSSVTFTWNDVGASLYQVWVGTTVGGLDLGYFPTTGTTGTSTTVTGLPTDGRTLYVRLYSNIGGVYYARDYTYTAFSPPVPTPAAISSPVQGSTLAGSSVTFQWNDVGASLYQVWIGNSVGAFDIGFFPAAGTTSLSTTVNGLPTDGRTVYVRLYSNIGGVYYSRDYTYTAANVVAPTPAVISSPANGSTLAGTSQLFSWNNAGATSYLLTVGNAPGDQTYFSATTAGTSATAPSLPNDGRMLFVRLSSTFGGTTVFNDYTYTAFNAAMPTKAVMQSPANGSTLGGASQLFTWNASGATLFQVWVGTSPGAYDLGFFPAAGTVGTSTTVTGLPTDGRTLYVRLYSLVSGAYQFNDYVYTAFAAGAPSPASMTSPAPGATISGGTVTFNWSDASAALYQVWVGNSQGAFDLGYYPTMGTTGLSTTINGLPTDGRTIHVRLYSNLGGTYYFRDYTYTAGP
jgi:predicted nucleotidyltransferase